MCGFGFGCVVCCRPSLLVILEAFGGGGGFGFSMFVSFEVLGGWTREERRRWDG